MNISMHREILGYANGDRKKPIYKAMPGQLVTQALINCCQCRAMISGNMGPRWNAWCIPCTDEGEKTAAKEKKAARKKAAIDAARKKAAEIARKKAEADLGADENE